MLRQALLLLGLSDRAAAGSPHRDGGGPATCGGPAPVGPDVEGADRPAQGGPLRSAGLLRGFLRGFSCGGQDSAARISAVSATCSKLVTRPSVTRQTWVKRAVMPLPVARCTPV